METHRACEQFGKDQTNVRSKKLTQSTDQKPPGTERLTGRNTRKYKYNVELDRNNSQKGKNKTKLAHT